ncbi:MAG: hypothetical protein ACK2T4_09805 [Candidatus Promineifilaceae bacterium]
MKKSLLLFLIFLHMIFAGQAAAVDDNGLTDLWIDLSMGAPLVDLFNERARTNDIARVEHVSQLDLLEGVTAGKKLVVFKSADDAIRLIPHIYDKIDIVGYNLEHGPANPIFEQENPVESIQSLREVTDEYGLELALGPDHRFAESDGAAMAPYADYFILQVQKVQTEPETVYEFVEPLLKEIHRANPDIEVSLQIRTEGNVDDLLAMLSPLQDDIQGISILTSEETLDLTNEIMNALRPPGSVEQPEITPELADEDKAEETAEPIATAVTNDNSDIKGEEADQSENDTDMEAIQAVQTLPPTPVPTATEIVSTAEANEHSGTSALFIVIAIIAGFALGAGYVSHRTGM